MAEKLGPSHLVYSRTESTEYIPPRAHINDLAKGRKLSGRGISQFAGIEHTVVMRLRSGDIKNPSVTTVASLMVTLSHEPAVYQQIVIDAVPPERRATDGRSIFREEAPALDGSLPEQLRGYRMARGLSLEQLAEKSGVNRSNVFRAERGTVPLFDTFASYVYALGLNTSQTANLILAAASQGERDNDQNPELI